jgi:prolyl oligopeptidase
MEEIEGAKALQWARAENARSLPQLQNDPRYKSIYADAAKIITAKDRIPAVSFAGDGTLRDFWQDAEHVRGIWRTTTVESYRTGTPQLRTILDLDALAKAEKANWVWHSPKCLPPEDRYCLLELSDGGKDAAVVREFDTQTGKFVESGFAIPEAKSDYAWIDRDTLLVVHEWQKGQLTESGYPYIVKMVKRGQPLSAAKEVFRGTVKNVAVGPRVLREPDGRVAGVVLNQSIDFFNSTYHLLREAPANRVRQRSSDEEGGPYEAVKLDLPSKSTIQGYVAGRLLVSLEQDWPAPSKVEGLQGWRSRRLRFGRCQSRAGKTERLAGAAADRAAIDRDRGDDPGPARGGAVRKRQRAGPELRPYAQRMGADQACAAD